MSQDQAAQAFEDALLVDDPAQLYDRAPCGYLSTLPDGRITKANATFLTWTGYSAEELAARSFVDLLSVGGRIYHETHYAPMLRMQGTVREIAVDVVRKDGTRLPVLVNARLDRDAAGEARVVRIALFDATERRQYERELVAAKELAEQSEVRARTLARTLQQTLIPPLPPAVPRLDVAAAYRPAGDGTEVGGDFYDVFPVGADDWVVVLGDVCGKGAEAAVVTALVRYSLRSLAAQSERPSEILRQLNEVVRRHETDRFCTVGIGRLRRDRDGWSATLASGGHPSPVLVRRGRPPEVLDVLGPLVGVVPGATYADERLPLHPGDLLLYYTDGVTEARNADGFYGDDRMLEVVAARAADGPHALVDGLLREVVDFQAGVTRDDVALLALAVPLD